MSSPYGSDDETPHEGFVSQPSTAEHTMPSSPKPGKKVNWTDDNLRHNRPSSSTRDQSTETARLAEEHLRDRVHEIFSQTPPTTGPPRNGQRAAQPSKPALRISGSSTPVLNTPVENDITDNEDKARSLNFARDKAHRLSKSLGDGTDLETISSQEEIGKRVAARENDKKRKRSKSPGKRRIFDLYHDADDEFLRSEQTLPVYDEKDFVPRPAQYRTAGLSAMALLDRFKGSLNSSRRSSLDDGSTSGTSTPTLVPRFHSRSPNHSPRHSYSSFTSLVGASYTQGGSIAGSGVARDLIDRVRADKRPDILRSNSEGDANLPRSGSSGFLDVLSKVGKKSRPGSRESRATIKKHVQETRSRQIYLLKLSKALMNYGAPTHRLEEYMKMSARVLETEAQFLYIPGCMLISFDDSRSHTTEMKLVRTNGGIDLGKLTDCHDIYKQVVHDNIGVEEATVRLDEVAAKQDKFNKWWLILAHGVASAMVGPFAFNARFIDLGPAFVLGLIMGVFRVWWATRADLYACVFEVCAVVLTSFLSRLLGSLKDGELFCFSALAQSSVALILPGYPVLLGALELQSRSIVAGAARLVWAIVFSLFLGFSLTIGTAIYGIIDSNATSRANCTNPPQGSLSLAFVPPFALSLMVIFQAKFRQMPVMLVIALGGYLVLRFSSGKFQSNSAIASSLGALAISIMANLYSRLDIKFDKTWEQMGTWFSEKVRAARRRYAPQDPEKQQTSADRVNTREETAAQSQSRPQMSAEAAAPTSEAGTAASSTTDLSSTSQKEPGKEKRSIRVGYSLAATAMLPAILVQVPSGLSVAGSLVEGIQSANEIVSTNNTAMSNSATASSGNVSATAMPSASATANSSATLTSTDVTSGNVTNSIAFTVGYSVVQVAIGITVGLYLGALVVYPFGKGGKSGLGKRSGKHSRSGLFTF